MQANGIGVLIEKIRHLPLAEPYGIPLKAHFQRGGITGGLVNNDVAFIITREGVTTRTALFYHV
jgi:hypothetical protein